MKIADMPTKYLLTLAGAAAVSIAIIIVFYKSYSPVEIKQNNAINTLTPEQARAFEALVLAQSQAPQPIQNAVHELLAAPSGKKFILDLPKQVRISSPVTNKLQKRAPEELARLQDYNKAALKELAATAKERTAFYKKQHVVQLAHDANTAVLTTDEWDFVLRVPIYEWYDDFEDNGVTPLVPSKFQNVSRVFYGKQINDFIAHNNITRVYPLQQWLVHIPGRPEELSDENYLVAVEKITDLPSTKVNLERFQELVDNKKSKSNSAVEISDEWTDLVRQFLQVMKEAALWNITPNSVYLIERDHEIKALFLNTEKPGLGGGFDKHFYHMHAGEVSSNLRTGMEGFAAMIESNPAKREQLLKQFKKMAPRKNVGKKKVVAKKQSVKGKSKRRIHCKPVTPVTVEFLEDLEC